MDINHQAAIVTGGASGLGAQTARGLAAAGAKVAVLDINKAAIDALASEIGGLSIGCDVTSEAAVKEALAQATAAHGAPRICVNCAGVIKATRLVGKTGPMSLEEFTHVVNVNLIGSFNVMRLVAEQMVPQEPLGEAQERGVIINTASIAAYEGQIGQVAYSASKGGVAGMTLPVARELAQFGIRVVAIAPGFFETPLLGNITPQAKAALEATTEFPKRLGNPTEFASFVREIVGNPMFNGSVVRLDGAVRMTAR